jgi:hypothetical protein
MSRRVPFWKKSKVYQDKRRPNLLGAFAKWRRENAEEAQRINERFQREQKEVSI